jgi:cytochrome P450 family 135
MEASLPPGPTLPGLVQSLRLVTRPRPFLEQCRRRFGDVFTINAAPYGRMVYVADPEAIRHVFTGDPHVFHTGGVRRPLAPMLGTHSLLLLDEAEHLRERRLMLPPFHGAALRGYPPLMRGIAEAEIARWPTGAPIALRPRMQALTLEVILRVVIGVRDPDALARLRDAFTRLLGIRPTLLFLISALERDLRWFPPWRRFAATRAEVYELLHEQIRRRRAEQAGDDVLSLLVHSSTPDGDGLTDEELRDELVTLLVAGHETTATALAWAFERLTRNPRVLAKLRESLAAGDESYLDAVVKETLRSRPVVMEVGRDLTEPIDVAGHQLAAGTRLMVAIGVVQQSASHHPDPSRFEPERFLQREPPAYTWIPFGGGPRRCLGASFATLEMATVIRAVLERFDVGASRPEPEPARMRHVTYTPARGGEVVLAPRSERTLDARATVATAG